MNVLEYLIVSYQWTFWLFPFFVVIVTNNVRKGNLLSCYYIFT